MTLLVERVGEGRAAEPRKVDALQGQQRLVRVAGQAQQAAHGRFPLEPFIKTQAQHLPVEGGAKALKQGGHQAEVAPAMTRLEGIRGEVELDWPALAIWPVASLLGDPDLFALASHLPALCCQCRGKEGRGRMLAEDVEIAAGSIQPDGDCAHQGQIVAQGAKLIPQAAAQQGVGRALTFVALGQIVEAAPVGGGRWKNCGRGRSGIRAWPAGITRQGSPW